MRVDEIMRHVRAEGVEEGRAEGREEGRIEGREEGREEGRIEGREEGRIEGRVEGREEGRKEVLIIQITKKLAKGKTAAQIAEELEIEQAEVERLIAKQE